MREFKPKRGGGDGIFLHIVVMAWVFVVSLALLNFTGFVPYYIDGTPSNAVKAEATKRDAEVRRLEQERKKQEETNKLANQPAVLPTRLEIPSTGKVLTVSNPNTTDIDALDKELLTSVVRYPGSGTLGKDGNVFIFGHSTNHKTVHNPLYKAFNDLKSLDDGNVIKLISGGRGYVYAVSGKRHEKASNVTVEFGTKPGVKRLTLSTCDSFGAKSDRWIITADFVGSYDTASR